MRADVLHGDCVDVLRQMPDNSIDAVVTDPPYGLGFMGKKWDHGVPDGAVWAECLRVLKPGGHLLAFAGTRTQHRMAVRIEDAGFEIRDLIAWVYGSGMPKSHDVSKALDKAAGAVREVIGQRDTKTGGDKDRNTFMASPRFMDVTAPATPSAEQWQGWGTALKPALEPITVARKPLAYTVAGNVTAWGTGALNIDGCRVSMGDEYDPDRMQRQAQREGAWSPENGGAGFASDHVQPTYNAGGRWPANLIHDGSEDVLEQFPQSGDSGSAARFFYCAKANKTDRGEGNEHPTVKPTSLMRYLCRLVTPPGGTVLDPFTGSGSTGKAAVLEGFAFVGVELEAASVETARRRIAQAQAEVERQRGPLFGGQ